MAQQIASGRNVGSKPVIVSGAAAQSKPALVKRQARNEHPVDGRGRHLG